MMSLVAVPGTLLRKPVFSNDANANLSLEKNGGLDKGTYKGKQDIQS